MNNSLNSKSNEKNIKDEPEQKVKVSLLESLMNLAGELVLCRNQLMQGISKTDMKSIESSGQRIDLITSELQDAIMKTRMDKLASIFDRFTENVDGVGRNIDFTVKGRDVELDKTVLEGIEEPLQNLLENCIEFGIEQAEERKNKGKSENGTIQIKAFQDAGQININFFHDGVDEKGKIVTKEIVSQIEEIGGVLETNSELKSAYEYQIKLPLTLAIIPSQITSVGDEQYAIPQANLSELIRIPANDVKKRIETVGDAEVVRLRGELLPILNLGAILGVEKSWLDESGNKHPERRVSISDRRSKKYTENGNVVSLKKPENDLKERKPEDRRKNSSKAINIAVVHAGNFKYGLVIDELYDSEEIVVKPLGRNLKKYKTFAGATIMGNGKVALILDILNIALNQNLATVEESNSIAKSIEEKNKTNSVKESLVLFKNLETEYFAAPFESVERIERIPADEIEVLSKRKVVQYRGGALPLFELSDTLNLSKLPEREQLEVIVFNVNNRQFGLMVTPPVDTIEVVVSVDDSTLKQSGVKGSMILNNHTTLLVDLAELSALFFKSYEVE